MIKQKKSQEEMIGFVLIIVLVSVIALIFLAIGLRKPVEMQKSRDVENFLHSIMFFTSSCKSNTGFYDFKDLIGNCFKNERCIDGEDSCKILNKTSVELIEKSFKIGEEERYKAYKFSIYEENRTILDLNKGNFTYPRIGADIMLPISGENLHVRLELFY